MKYKTILLSGLAGLCLLAAGCSSTAGGESASSGRPVIRAVTHANWNPFEFLDKGQITGFDIELLRTMAEKAGYKADISDTGWEAIFEQIRQGQADLAISGITITKERKESYAFSMPYFVSRQAILTADSSIQSAQDLLSGKTIAVQNGSTGQEVMEKLLGKNAPALKKTPMSIQMLVGNQVDAIVGDATSCEAIARQYGDRHFRIIYDDAAFTPERFGILYPAKGDPAIRNNMDKALKALIADGTYQKLYEKWFHAAPPEEFMDTLQKGAE